MSITALAAAEREYKPIGLGDRQERCSSSALHVCLKRPVDAKSTRRDLQLTFDDAFVVLDEIGKRIVASIASEIETLERHRAILKPPSSLDAWGAHHRGSPSSPKVKSP